MKEIKLQNNTYLFVEVPDDCIAIQVAHNIINKPNSLIFDYSVKLISTTKDITEEQAGSIVEFKTETLYPEGFEPYVTSGYRNYNIPYTGIFNIQRAKESLQSLIQANGLDGTKNYLILKKL